MEFPKELEKFREKLERTYKTCNEIKFVPSDTKPWESKINLTDRTEWRETFCSVFDFEKQLTMV